MLAETLILNAARNSASGEIMEEILYLKNPKISIDML
jgi:hypothetical protein